jgi:chromosome segregation ATPase
LSEVKASHQQQLDDISVHKTRHSEFQKELDKLNSTINQVEAHYRELLGQVAVSKREAFKTEEDITRMEKDKQSQDLLIDKLSEQIKQLEDKLALTTAQLDAQKQETAFAAKTLAEAGSEMEVIQFQSRNQFCRKFTWRRSNC